MSSVHVVKGAHHACYSDPSSVCPALPVEQTDAMITRRPVRMDLRSVWTSLRRSGRAMMLLLWRTNSYIEITTTVPYHTSFCHGGYDMAIVHIMAVMVTYGSYNNYIIEIVR